MPTKIKTLKYIPFEIFLILIPSIVIFLIISIFNFNLILNRLNVIYNKIDFFQILLKGSKFGYALLFITIILVLFLIKSIVTKDLTLINNLRKSGVRAFLLFNILMISLTCLVFSTIFIYHIIPAEKVLNTTIIISKLDKNLFKLDILSLPIIFQNSIIETLTLYSYYYLTIIYSTSLIILAFFKKQAFKDAIRAFLLFFIIAIPIWYFIPILSPDALYNSNIFSQKIFNISQTSSLFQIFNQYFQSIWIDQTGLSFSISSLPSLHAGLGLIIFWYFLKTKINSFIKLIFLVWFVFEVLGTFYSLQHFIIDSVFGLLLANLVIIFLNWLSKKESNYYLGPDLYSFCDFLTSKNKDIPSYKTIVKFLTNKIP